jgi:hypothetical protein
MRKLLLLGILVANFAYAGVQVEDGKISADVNQLPLNQVLQSLKQQTKIQFSIDDAIGGQTISARFQNLTIAAGIKKMLEGTGINYVVMADASGQPTSVFIGKSEKPGGPPKKLDTRPVTNMPNRGVVQPVQPIQQQPQQRINNQPGDANRQNQNRPAGIQNNAPAEVPTGGSLVSPAPQPQINPNMENRTNPDDLQSDEDEEDPDEDEE